MRTKLIFFTIHIKPQNKQKFVIFAINPECMNLLAHLFLSGKDQQITLGNFIADAVKGKQVNQYSRKIQQGIQLHHNIDSFTDNHSTVKKSIKLLRPKYHMYAGVIVDLAYDHFLAKNWKQYSDLSLHFFINNSYELLLKNFRILPERTKVYLPFMIMNNWLKNYEKLSGLHHSLEGLARRTSFKSGMEHAIKDIKSHYDILDDHFNLFFPDIMHFVKQNPHVQWYDQE